MCAKTVFRIGRGDNLRNIDVGTAYETSSAEKSKILLGFHAFTGWDQTGNFANYKIHLLENVCIFPFICFICIYKTSSGLALDEDDVIPGLSHLVQDLYQPNRLKAIDTIGKLRWYMFTKKQLETENAIGKTGWDSVRWNCQKKDFHCSDVCVYSARMLTTMWYQMSKLRKLLNLVIVVLQNEMIRSEGILDVHVLLAVLHVYKHFTFKLDPHDFYDMNCLNTLMHFHVNF